MRPSSPLQPIPHERAASTESDGLADTFDLRMMRMAIDLGSRHLGQTWPNPSVGALVVACRRVVSRGITQPSGRPHAERMALEAAGDCARGATLYVSLEPCAHHGRTPPCIDAVIAAGIARVVTAIDDPDPRVSGQGHARLRMAGIDVVTGVLAREARDANLGHILRVSRGRPAVTVKLACTADGFAARSVDSERLLISGEAANAQVHMMRAHADAILVGIGTVLTDDPMLTVRLPGLEARSPQRIVFDSMLRLADKATRLVASSAQHPLWVIATTKASLEAEKRLVALGVEVMRVEPDAGGRVDPAAALALLAARGVTSIFCEGGPALAEAFGGADLVDRIVRIVGRESIGNGVRAFGPQLSARMASFERTGRRTFGSDAVETYERPF